jgi:hypothetical protein
MVNEIRKSLNDPRKLEALYRKSPKLFREAFDTVYLESADSMILRVWHERLHYSESDGLSRAGAYRKDLTAVVILSLISGLYAKLPAIFPGIDQNFFYSRNISFFVFPALAAYFIQRNGHRNRRLSLQLFILFLLFLLFINLLPDIDQSQTVILSCVHMPFVLWAMLGIAFMQQQYRQFQQRILYLKYNGELLIYTALILIGGMVLTGITMALFSAIKVDIEKFYLEYVVIFGMVASPVVGSYIVTNISKDRLNIAPIISKIFSPLFLITFSLYLIVMLITGKSPYTDRNFLIVYNFMLMIVLAIVIFSISDRAEQEKNLSIGILNIFLILVVLILDIIALSAIIYRLSTYGLSPNRIAVLGANLLIMINLSGILITVLRYLKHQDLNQKLSRWIGQYLTFYTAWSVIVVILFPFIFLFK